MLFSQITRQNRTPCPLLHLSCRLVSRLYEHYNFIAPPSLHSQFPTLKPAKQKRKKPPYRPPSSLDTSNHETIHSVLPFDFRFSYTESNQNIRPIGLREPKYSPFGPNRVDRVWTGVAAPAIEPVLESVDEELINGEDDLERKRKMMREKVIGEPLTHEERSFLIDSCQKNRAKRQVNLGRDGLTHNMLNDIHNNWKNAEAVRIKCLGVPTIDMKNVCTQLEDKTGGLIIHRQRGQIILYRGRYYNPKKRPIIPLMLWKPHEPIYPRLIKTTIEGLTIEETKDMRKKGLSIPPLTKLAKNGYYAFLVPLVRDAFLTDELVRLDCKGLPRSDYKKIGVKLRDLVPCIPVSFDKEQVVLWRGKSYNGCTNHNREDSEDNSFLDFEMSTKTEKNDNFSFEEVSNKDPFDATY